MTTKYTPTTTIDDKSPFQIAYAARKSGRAIILDGDDAYAYFTYLDGETTYDDVFAIRDGWVNLRTGDVARLFDDKTDVLS